jgi:protocatechuate 3,4-dioxygenase beta subunit
MKLALALICLGSLANGHTHCALEGRVVDQKTGQPLARTHLFAIGQALAAIRASTNEDGRFCFPRLDSGSYHVVAQRAGYLEAVYQGSRHPGIYSAIEMKPESRLAPVTIEMVPRAIMVGKVVDADGSAVARAQVRASSARPAGLEGSGNTVYTDGAGGFRFYDLDPGNYRLTALPPMDFASWGNYRDGTGGSLQERIVETPFPAAIVLEAGREIKDVVITMQRVRLRHLSGRVVGIAGAKNLIAEIRFSSGGSEGRNIEIHADGTFYLDSMLPGRYVLHLAGAEDKVVDLTNGDGDGILIAPQK